MPLESTEQSERRMWQRFPARFPARVKDARGHFGDNQTLRDASATGVRLVSRDRFYLNDSLALEVQLPDGQSPMNIHGEVVWTHSTQDGFWHVGLRMHKMDLMHFGRLYKFVSPHPE